MSREHGVDRRSFFKTVGAAGAAAALPGALPVNDAAAQAHMHPMAPKPSTGMPADQAFTFLTGAEAAFMAAAVDVFIPKDDVGPGGVESGVVTYIDRQLAGGWGRGARLYLQGPFAEGKPEQGYQLPLTPAEVYRLGIADVNTWCRANRGGKTFDQLSPADRDAVLKDLMAGKLELAQAPGRTLVGLMLANTMEGYFADPVHGGNRDMGSWKMIGFPGAGGVFATEIEEYRNKPYPVDPQSIADLS
jgi:gluconate 2-dehydrogenase gamma chain